MSIDNAIRIFAHFLDNSWSIVTPLLWNREYTTNEASVNDWLQANWELLVERKILKDNEYLEIYSEGADFNGSSSRITDYHKISTHKITLLAVKETDVLNEEMIENKEFDLDRLVGFKNGFYINEPPFEFALIFDHTLNKERVFKIVNVQFRCRLIDTSSE